MKCVVRTVLSLIAIASTIVLSSCGGAGGRSDGAGGGSNLLVISISPAPPTGTANIAYPGFSFAVASGGTAPFVWSETGVLPLGLMFSSGGQLSGTPTNTGSFPITVRVRDSLGQNAGPQTFTIQISAQASVFTPTNNMQSPREWHTATPLHNGEVLVIGGFDNSQNVLAAAELFDPIKAVFVSAGALGTARVHHTATLLKNGKVLVTGGSNSNARALAVAEIFNPKMSSFGPTVSDLGTARSEHAATLLSNGTVLVTGGLDSNGNALETAELFDPVSETFTPTGSLAGGPRLAHTATLLSDGTVFVTGGLDNSGNALATAEVYDPNAGTFTTTGSLGTARYAHTATLLMNGKVLVAGGLSTPTDDLASAELFDPSTGSFETTLIWMEQRRSAHTATLRADGTILIAGGSILSTGICGLNCITLVPLSSATAEVFNPITQMFTPTGDLGTSRFSHTATLLDNGTVLITGGVTALVRRRQLLSSVLSTAELFH
jgi:hypothetical protein